MSTADLLKQRLRDRGVLYTIETNALHCYGRDPLYYAVLTVTHPVRRTVHSSPYQEESMASLHALQQLAAHVLLHEQRARPATCGVPDSFQSLPSVQ